MNKKDSTNRADDILLAIHYLKLTLPEMSKREIATTPENYAIWYEYLSELHCTATANVRKSLFTEQISAYIKPKKMVEIRWWVKTMWTTKYFHSNR